MLFFIVIVAQEIKLLTPDIGHISHPIIQLAMESQCQSVVIAFYRLRCGTAEPSKLARTILHTQITRHAAFGLYNLFLIYRTEQTLKTDFLM